MATFYIQKITKAKHPALIADMNTRLRDRSKPATTLYDLNYGMKYLGFFRSVEEAKAYAKKYSKTRLNSESVEFRNI